MEKGVYVRTNGNELVGLWQKKSILGDELTSKMSCLNGDCENGEGESIVKMVINTLAIF